MRTDSTDNQLFAGRGAEIWRIAANHPVLAILLLTISQNGLTLWARDLWWADEVRHAGVLLQILDSGDWLALNLNGEFYPDKPPLYFLFLTALMRLLSSREQWVVFFGLAVTVFIFFMAIYHLAYRLLSDRRMALLAVVMAATCSYIIALSHYARMDFLFTAFICASWACFYDGIQDKQANRKIVFGFVWSALAIMTKGPLGFAFPVLGLVGYLWWSGRLSIILRRDFAVGLLLAVIVSVLWAAGVVHFAGLDYLMHLLRGQIVERGLRSDRGVLEHARYFVTLPLVFMPWTLVFFVGWRQWRQKRGVIARTRAALQTGVFFATGCLIVGFGIISAIAEKHEYYLLPLLVLLCIVATSWYSQLRSRQFRTFWFWVAAFFVVTGAVFIIVGSLPEMKMLLAEKYGVTMFGVVSTGGVSVLLGASLWFLRARAQPVLLLLILAGQSLWINLLVLQIFASLNPIWSTKAVAEMAKPFLENGYSLGINHGVRGVFTYHLGEPYTRLGDAEGTKIWLMENPRAIVIMPRYKWRRSASQFPELSINGCARVAGLEMVLLSDKAAQSLVSGAGPEC